MDAAASLGHWMMSEGPLLAPELQRYGPPQASNDDETTWARASNDDETSVHGRRTTGSPIHCDLTAQEIGGRADVPLAVQHSARPFSSAGSRAPSLVYEEEFAANAGVSELFTAGFTREQRSENRGPRYDRSDAASDDDASHMASSLAETSQRLGANAHGPSALDISVNTEDLSLLGSLQPLTTSQLEEARQLTDSQLRHLVERLERTREKRLQWEQQQLLLLLGKDAIHQATRRVGGDTLVPYSDSQQQLDTQHPSTSEQNRCIPSSQAPGNAMGAVILSNRLLAPEAVTLHPEEEPSIALDINPALLEGMRADQAPLEAGIWQGQTLQCVSEPSTPSQAAHTGELNQLASPAAATAVTSQTLDEPNVGAENDAPPPIASMTYDDYLVEDTDCYEDDDQPLASDQDLGGGDIELVDRISARADLEGPSTTVMEPDVASVNVVAQLSMCYDDELEALDDNIQPKEANRVETDDGEQQHLHEGCVEGGSAAQEDDEHAHSQNHADAAISKYAHDLQRSDVDHLGEQDHRVNSHNVPLALPASSAFFVVLNRDYEGPGSDHAVLNSGPVARGAIPAGPSKAHRGTRAADGEGWIFRPQPRTARGGAPLRAAFNDGFTDFSHDDDEADARANAESAQLKARLKELRKLHRSRELHHDQAYADEADSPQAQYPGGSLDAVPAAMTPFPPPPDRPRPGKRRHTEGWGGDASQSLARSPVPHSSSSSAAPPPASRGIVDQGADGRAAEAAGTTTCGTGRGVARDTWQEGVHRAPSRVEHTLATAAHRPAAQTRHHAAPAPPDPPGRKRGFDDFAAGAAPPPPSMDHRPPAGRGTVAASSSSGSDRSSVRISIPSADELAQRGSTSTWTNARAGGPAAQGRPSTAPRPGAVPQSSSSRAGGGVPAAASRPLAGAAAPAHRVPSVVTLPVGSARQQPQTNTKTAPLPPPLPTHQQAARVSGSGTAAGKLLQRTLTSYHKLNTHDA